MKESVGLMIQSVKIYRACMKASFTAAYTYRVNFLLSVCIMLLSNLLFPLITILIYGSGASFPNWNLYEALMIQAVFLLSSGISNMLFNGVLYATMRYVSEGNFEIVLLKPVESVFFLIASAFEIDSVGTLAGGLVMLCIAVSHVAAIEPLMWGAFALLFCAGIFVQLGISLIMAATSFKWIGNSRIPEIFESIKTFGKYPQSIFPKAICNVTSYIIPVAMIGFFPSSALLGRTSPIIFFAVLPCLLFGAAGIFLYQHMIRLYQGVGG
jgi:ABC-2 type transport system permease protein